MNQPAIKKTIAKLALFTLLLAGPALATPPATAIELVAQTEGMHCGGCAKRLSTVLTRVAHVHQAEANHETGQVMMRCDARVDRKALRKAIEDAGIKVVSLGPPSAKPATR